MLVIKFWVDEKIKPCGTCVEYGKADFNFKMFANELNKALPLRAEIEKTFHELETNWYSYKETVRGSADSKLRWCWQSSRIWNNDCNWFSWKRGNCKQCFLLPMLQRISILFTERPSYIAKTLWYHSNDLYIYIYFFFFSFFFSLKNFFSAWNVRNPALINRQPGVITQFR